MKEMLGKIKNQNIKNLASRIIKYANEKNNDNLSLKNVIKWIGNTNTENIWAFNSGHDGESFRGNPKYLFAYINEYRPDIRSYWICSNQKVIELIRGLGYHAYLDDSIEASYLIENTGVYVSEQVKTNIPHNSKMKYLNLWHGNGIKSSERARIEDSDELRMPLAKKYIKNNSFYLNNMIVCCANSFQESMFYNHMGITEDQVLRCGYPRLLYQNNYKPIITFDHDIIKKKGLDENTKIVVYATTIRKSEGHTFFDAIKNIDKLYDCCEKNNILFIFKMHPMAETEFAYINAKGKYKDKPNFLFWDNDNDIYEIMHNIDLLIYDYSSIFSDFLLAGVNNFIRYLYDEEEMVEAASIDNPEQYYADTCGDICKTFDELLSKLNNINSIDHIGVDELRNKVWEYAGDNDFEKIIEFTNNYKIKQIEYPTLYSFDIFDTLLTRKGVSPKSIFFAVRDRMKKNKDMFSTTFVDQYPQIRVSIELCLREFMAKSKMQRNSFCTEITFDEIFEKMADFFNLSEDQISLLKQWEIEEEIDSVIPIDKQISKVKELISKGETVILISDMYLPKTVINRMIEKADPILTQIPLFLSNEYGVLKSSGLLFFEVYRSFKPYYKFSAWIHTGDKIIPDQREPRKLCISTRKAPEKKLSDIQTALVEHFKDYNGYLLAGISQRLNEKYSYPRGIFVSDFVAPLFTSYIDCVLHDAILKGFKTLYFVSRDGYFLKQVADIIISKRKLNIKTKYIYTSRKVLRIPSYIDKVDSEFFDIDGGSFNDITNKEEFIDSAGFDSIEEFYKVIPWIDLDSIDFSDWSIEQPGRKLAEMLRTNKDYNEYLLKKAKKDREIISEYLLQEIDPNEKHAFVEFWGRGYNQLCHSRIWNDTLSKEVPLYYYYARSLFSSEGNCVRYSMTSFHGTFYFVEGIFSNLPYKTISKYEKINGKIQPILEPNDYDEDLYTAISDVLPEYVDNYLESNLSNYFDVCHKLFDFILFRYRDFQSDPFIYSNFGKLDGSVAYNNTKQEFARKYTAEDVEGFANGEKRGKRTRSIIISYSRSSPKVQEAYNKLYQVENESQIVCTQLLSKEQISLNDELYKKRIKETEKYEQLASLYYQLCKENGITNTITLVSCSSREQNADLLYILNKKFLQKLENVKICHVNRNKLNDNDILLLVSSKCIIFNGQSSTIPIIKYRNETKTILINKFACPLRKTGYLTSYILKNRNSYERFCYDVDFDIIDSSSKFSRQFLQQIYNFNNSIVKEVKGSIITDVYFDDEYKNDSKKLLLSRYPEIKDKKIILYLPDLRYKYDESNWCDLLDIDRLYELLGNEYYLLIDTRNRKSITRKCPNHLNIEGFSKLINSYSDISIRNLISCCDIFVGDYRDSYFESVLMNKPIYFTGYDFELKLKDQNVRPELFDDLPFPIVKSSEELASLIKSNEAYDLSSLQSFKNKYFEYCDGFSTDRLMSLVIEDK